MWQDVHEPERISRGLSQPTLLSAPGGAAGVQKYLCPKTVKPVARERSGHVQRVWQGSSGPKLVLGTALSDNRWWVGPVDETTCTL